MYNRAAPLNALALQLANSLPESESLLCWASIIWQCLHASIPCPCREHELFPYLTEPWHWRAQERFGQIILPNANALCLGAWQSG